MTASVPAKKARRVAIGTLYARGENAKATIDWSSLSTGYGLRPRCGKPCIHARRALRLVGMLCAGTLSGSEPFHRCTSALEKSDDGPQNPHGDHGGQGRGGDGQGRAGGGEVQLGVHGKLLRLNRMESPGIAVRRFCLPGRFSPLGG